MMTGKVQPVLELTETIDRSGDRGFDVVEFGRVIDSLTGKDLMPGRKVTDLQGSPGSNFSVVTVYKPDPIAYAISHVDGAVKPLDRIEMTAFNPEDSRLYDLKWLDMSSICWARPFFKDLVWQENGGYQAKFITKAVVWDSRDIESCTVQFIEENGDLGVLMPYIFELRKMREAKLTAMSRERVFEYRNMNSCQTYITSYGNQIKIDILPQKFIYWICATDFNKL